MDFLFKSVPRTLKGEWHVKSVHMRSLILFSLDMRQGHKGSEGERQKARHKGWERHGGERCASKKHMRCWYLTLAASAAAYCRSVGWGNWKSHVCPTLSMGADTLHSIFLNVHPPCKLGWWWGRANGFFSPLWQTELVCCLRFLSPGHLPFPPPSHLFLDPTTSQNGFLALSLSFDGMGSRS